MDFGTKPFLLATYWGIPECDGLTPIYLLPYTSAVQGIWFFSLRVDDQEFGEIVVDEKLLEQPEFLFEGDTVPFNDHKI